MRCGVPGPQRNSLLPILIIRALTNYINFAIHSCGRVGHSGFLHAGTLTPSFLHRVILKQLFEDPPSALLPASHYVQALLEHHSSETNQITQSVALDVMISNAH